MTSRPAFSLFELIIVVSVVGIILMVSTTALMSLRRHTQVRSAIDRYVATHSFARATAVRMGRTTQLRADTIRKRVWVEIDSSHAQAGWQGKMVGDMTYFDDLRFGTKRTTLCFDPRGLPTSGFATPGLTSCQGPDAEVIFSYAHRSDTLRITALGRVVR